MEVMSWRASQLRASAPEARTLQTSFLPRVLPRGGNRGRLDDWRKQGDLLIEEGREQCLFQVKDQHGQEQRERRRHSGLAGQWLWSLSTCLVSSGWGVSGAVRRVGGEEGRSRAQDGMQAKLRSGFGGGEIGVHGGRAPGMLCSALRLGRAVFKTPAQPWSPGEVEHETCM